MKFKFITPSHAYYPQELMLRWEVLKKPQGLPPGSELLQDEPSCIHLLAMEQKTILGCVVFHPDKEDCGTLAQIAMNDEFKGYSRKLLHALEQELIKRGYREIRVFAGDEQESFFFNLGYQLLEPYSLQKSREMKKKLLIDIAKSA